MKEKLICVADDGTEFNDKRDCAAYEFDQKFEVGSWVTYRDVIKSLYVGFIVYSQGWNVRVQVCSCDGFKCQYQTQIDKLQFLYGGRELRASNHSEIAEAAKHIKSALLYIQ